MSKIDDVLYLLKHKKSQREIGKSRFCRKLSALVQYFQNQLSLDTVMLLLHKTDPKLSSFQH
jgi:hypothetical protein